MSGSMSHVLIDLFFKRQDEAVHLRPAQIFTLLDRVTGLWWPQSPWEQHWRGVLKVQKNLISVVKGFGGGAGGAKSKAGV